MDVCVNVYLMNSVTPFTQKLKLVLSHSVLKRFKSETV